MASKTMSLDPQEWRALVISNLVNLHQFITVGNAPINDAEGVWFQSQLDRLKYQVSAWQASARPVDPLTMTDIRDELNPKPLKANGAEPQVRPISKKRGRPKGSRNTPITATQ